jgi:hypothetical protein
MAEQAKRSLYVQFLRIHNSHPHTMTISLEPWAEELLIAPNAIYEFAARGPEGDHAARHQGCTGMITHRCLHTKAGELSKGQTKPR